eukprot:scaffold23959_cov59-Cyclotella_meneghiniana.AAC.10
MLAVADSQRCQQSTVNINSDFEFDYGQLRVRAETSCDELVGCNIPTPSQRDTLVSLWRRFT